ncbi:hypothetical protein OS493_017949 [Desmophyllum pertusum]|uniref:G-protein coupled receptors family 1 profile domain-containing protein n=1 Tax=Desmophyllum pertusum TaxID=174260 RepID=A0A9W9Z028_9CNID|nr:hypothetical protein OS493_017949 [Desmophyllum pertusum]
MSSSLLVTVSETSVLCFICLAALIGNVSLYIIVYKNKDLRTITNLYILNLAAADIMVSVLSIPVTVVTIITERWVFGDTACTALGFFTILSFIASVMSLGMIALNRYFYIVKWNTYTKTFSKRKALLYAAAVWANLKRRMAVSRNNLTPPPHHHELTTENETRGNRNPDTEPDRNMAEGQRPHMNTPGGSELESKSKSRAFQVTHEETKITNTFLFVLALFVVCWAPFAVTMFFDVYYPRPLPRAVDIASLLLGYLNSMCNPVLYGLRNSAFKQGFLDLYSRFLPERFRPTSVTRLEMNACCDSDAKNVVMAFDA